MWLIVDDVLLTGMKRYDYQCGGADGRDTMPSYGRRSVEGRANLQDVKNACMILNTAEYCQSTSLQVRHLKSFIVRGDCTD